MPASHKLVSLMYIGNPGLINETLRICNGKNCAKINVVFYILVSACVFVFAFCFLTPTPPLSLVLVFAFCFSSPPPLPIFPASFLLLLSYTYTPLPTDFARSAAAVSSTLSLDALLKKLETSVRTRPPVSHCTPLAISKCLTFIVHHFIFFHHVFSFSFLQATIDRICKAHSSTCTQLYHSLLVI